MQDLCESCRHYREIVYVEEGTNRPFCQLCTAALPPTSDELRLLFLWWSTPFRAGDTVTARQVLSSDGTNIEWRTEGVGVVEEVSTDWHNGGTPIYPTFKVRFVEKANDLAPDEGWYTEICLAKVAA